MKFLFASWICYCCYSTAAVSSNHFSFPLIFIFLVKHEQETAISVFYSREDMIDQGYTTFGYLKMQMVVAHGGRCAERLVHGEDVTDGVLSCEIAVEDCILLQLVITNGNLV